MKAKGAAKECDYIFSYTLGNNSHLNLLGKVVFLLPVLVFAITWFLLHLVFAKDEGNS